MSAQYDPEYRIYTGKSEAHKAFNSLLGILQGISIDRKVNAREINELERWCETHEFLTKRNPFKDLLTNIQVIISDHVITDEELENMLWLCDKFKDGFDYYDKYTSDLQVLQGICHGILADGIIEEEEIKALQIWLSSHQHLSSFYPYDEIFSLITEFLQDGKIDEQEIRILKSYFNEFVRLTDSELQEQIGEETKDIKIGGLCTKVSSIDFDGRHFCFTGTSTRCSRSEIARIIEDQGGLFQNNVNAKTNYLIIGDDGNPCWAFACYGRKVEKALQLRKDGAAIVIVHENDFWRVVDGKSK